MKNSIRYSIAHRNINTFFMHDYYDTLLDDYVQRMTEDEAWIFYLLCYEAEYT